MILRFCPRGCCDAGVVLFGDFGFAICDCFGLS